ncbi:hypothetical protein D3C75_1065730 [compost metagenome]
MITPGTLDTTGVGVGINGTPVGVGSTAGPDVGDGDGVTAGDSDGVVVAPGDSVGVVDGVALAAGDSVGVVDGVGVGVGVAGASFVLSTVKLIVAEEPMVTGYSRVSKT